MRHVSMRYNLTRLPHPLSVVTHVVHIYVKVTERSEFTAVFLDNVQYLEYPRFCIGTVLTSELRSDKSTKSHCVHVLHVAMLVCTEVTHANYSSSSLSVSWRVCTVVSLYSY